MSANKEKFSVYLNKHKVLQRLLDVLKDLVETDPLPADPLMELLHAIGCPLIPQEQMKALERKVSRANEEVRQLRHVLIDLGREDDLYSSETDENEYVGQISKLDPAILFAVKEHYEDWSSDTSSSSRSASPQLEHYIVTPSIALKELEASLLPQTDQEEQDPCFTDLVCIDVQQSEKI